MASGLDALEHAVQLQQTGQLQAAEAIYRNILKSNPNHAPTLYFQGLIKLETRQIPAAIELFEQAIAADPNPGEYYTGLGQAYELSEQSPKALSVYQKGLQQDPSCLDLQMQLGFLYQKTGQLGLALEAFTNCVEADPSLTMVWFAMSNVLKEMEQFTDAINIIQIALQTDPQCAEVYFQWGLLLEYQYEHVYLTSHGCQIQTELLENSRDAYEAGLKLEPTDYRAWYNLGNIQQKLNMLNAAQASYEKTLSLQPNHLEALNNMGMNYRKANRIDDALQCYQRCLALNPDYEDAHYNISVTHLLQANFEDGWPEYEWRYHKAKMSKGIEKPEWTDQPLATKTLLVRCEQGFGDSLQFVRYLPLLKDQGAQVILECPDSLIPLFQHLPDIDRLIPLVKPDPEQSKLIHPVPFDYFIPLLSLPYRLKTRLNTIPCEVPYLQVPAERQQQAQQRLTELAEASARSECLKIGLVWAGNPYNVPGLHRSCPFSYFESLIQDCPQHQYFSLQKGGHRQTLPGAMVDLSLELNDFLDTAAFIQQLDLVISIDTSVVHLAGALNKPVWTMLPFVPDWRWLLDRTDTPWYPSMTLFRQSTSNDWASILNPIVIRLNDKQLIHSLRSPTH